MRSNGSLAALALGCYAIHAAWHLANGAPEHLLWTCHLAVVLVAIGFLLASPTWNAIGLCWSAMGNPLWLLDLAAGGEFIPTSLFTHAGGLALAIVGLRRFGMPAGVWWKAGALFAALQMASRAITPAEENVNVAFRVWTGWEGVFPSYAIFLAVSYPLLLGYFFAVERVAQRASGGAAADA